MILEMPKTAIRWTGLIKRTNHAGHLIGIAELVDSGGITLPGLTLQIEVKAPIDCERCLYQFSIMRLKNRQRRRFYQLEVAPLGKRTHNGATTLHGPHEHIEENEPIAIDHPDVRCENWAGALAWFFRRTHITHFDIPDPNHVAL